MYIDLRDRPEEGWLSKTGEQYRALVINETFAGELLALPDGPIVRIEGRTSRAHWFRFYPQEWLEPFVKDRKRLHRLRGLYADDVAALTRDAVAAHLAGVKAASEALGHTNTQTTERSYLSRASVASGR